MEKYNVSECLICGPILTEENIPFLLKEGMALLLMHIITIDTSLFICKTEQVSYIPKFTQGEELNQRSNAVFWVIISFLNGQSKLVIKIRMSISILALCVILQQQIVKKEQNHALVKISITFKL